MAPPSLSNVPVPHLYTEYRTDRGEPYYANHITKATSWIHPGKFKALQDAGIIPRAPRGMPDFVGNFDGDHVPVPEPWERKRDEEGRVYYANHATRSTAWRHPTALRLARDGGREIAVWGFADPADTRALEERYTSNGVLPPWVLEEKSVPPRHSGLQPETFWVDYRTGKVRWENPVDAYRARKARPQGLPNSSRFSSKL
ncbi:hypothetical protein RB595_010166 [Gaeumannomyces hyphopodioides]